MFLLKIVNDPQTKKEFIAEISSTATKTIEQAVRDSLKRALLQEFLHKTTGETIKWIKSSTLPEVKSKDNKIRYEANNNILEKIDDAINFWHREMPRKTEGR